MKQLAIAAVLVATVVVVSYRGHAGAGAVSMTTPAPLEHPRLHHAASAAAAVVYVAGAVARPGLYRLADGSRANDAVLAAGGFAPNADRTGVNLAARVEDGDEIAVPVAGEAPAHRGAASAKSRRRHKRTKHRTAVSAALDLNAASAEQLQELPGVGATLAQRIVAFREINGPFASVDELLDVAGMTQRRYDALAPVLRVNGVP